MKWFMLGSVAANDWHSDLLKVTDTKTLADIACIADIVEQIHVTIIHRMITHELLKTTQGLYT